MREKGMCRRCCGLFADTGRTIYCLNEGFTARGFGLWRSALAGLWAHHARVSCLHVQLDALRRLHKRRTGAVELLVELLGPQKACIPWQLSPSQP